MYENAVELKVERLPILQSKKTVKGVTKPYFINAYTGKSGFEVEDSLDGSKSPYQVIPVTQKQTLGLKIQWDENYEQIALIFCAMDTSCVKTEVKERRWEELKRCYVTKDKGLFSTTPQKVKGDWFTWDVKGSNHTEYHYADWSFEELMHVEKTNAIVIIDSDKLVYDDEGRPAWNQTEVMRPFHKLFGYMVPIVGNRIVCLNSMGVLNHFMRYNEPSNDSFQNKNDELNELLKYQLPDVEEPKKLPAVKKSYGYFGKALNPLYENVQKYAVIQRVKDAPEPLCVIRTFFKSPDYNVTKEGGRIYVSKKSIIASRTLMDGSFIYQKLLDKPVHWNFFIDDFDKDATKGTRLEYYGDIVENIEKKYRGLAIWSFMRYPITEQMYKIEYMRPYMDDLFKLSVVSSPIEILNSTFGKIEKEKNVFKCIGFNKWQAEMIFPLITENMPIIGIWNSSCYLVPAKALKFIFSSRGYGDVSNVDKESFSWCVDIISLIFERWPIRSREEEIQVATDWNKVYVGNGNYIAINNIIDSLQKTNETYGFQMMKNMFPSIFRNMGTMIEYHQRNYRTWYTGRLNTTMTGKFETVYCDYVNMVNMMHMSSRMKPQFNSMEELSAMHAIAVEMLNSKNDEADKQKWENRVKKANWSKWEYDNGTFVVVSPKTPGDLAEEGITLHHCVKSYIGRVSDGVTNIMFIRKKGEEDKPFFTVEVSNDSQIEQVHGSCNRNADTEPGMVEFVKEWAKTKKLKMHNFNKVR